MLGFKKGTVHPARNKNICNISTSGQATGLNVQMLDYKGSVMPPFMIRFNTSPPSPTGTIKWYHNLKEKRVLDIGYW